MSTENKLDSQTQTQIIDEIEIEEESAESFYEIMSHANVNPQDESFTETKVGLAVFLKYLLNKGSQAADQRISRKTIEDIIKEIDRRISKQMDAILHSSDFQKIESSWKQLYFLVNRINFSENITIDLLDASKEDLINDFEDNIETVHSGLYKHVYVNEYGQYGGKPIGAMIGAFDFDKTAEDTDLLRRMGSVAAMSHAPFIGNVDAKFFGLNSFENLTQIKDLESELESTRYKHWNSLRDSDDSRNIGLCMPRFMLRDPYGPDNPTKRFAYYEETNQENQNYLWGHASFAFATRLAESFAEYRWCPNIIGPQSGGTVDGLATHVTNEKGIERTYGPTETIISDRYEYVLSELGFIPLAVRKGTEKACFFSASSIQRPKYFGNDEEAKIKEMNYKLGTQLPYLFVINRLAHYLKVLQRENLGSWKSRSDIEEELNKWLRQYISDQENPSPAIRSQRPLRTAKLSVEEDVNLGAGWYKINLAVTPHFKFMGANFTLFLSSNLENQ